ncbi:MAG TPA: lyase family protein [Solirubrobacteraceae bacterium]|nr:lyase family protein [Solirubrobacteraceae bacterium]
MFEAIYARGAVAEQLSDRAWLRALVDVEVALARALADLGEIPEEIAIKIVAGARDIDRIGVDRLRRSLAEHATPVIGLVAALRDALGPPAAEYVHAGATSQDIVDTALMLLVRRALDPLLAELDGAAEAAARLAAEHRETPMIARTLLQQALPTTFGLHAAGWLDGLDEVRGHLVHVREAECAVQMGGPVGGRDPRVAARVASELGLVEPVMGWATIRVRTALTASVLGVGAGVLGKIARDVTLLSQTEVAEVAEGRAGGSSAMPDKRNPVASVAVLACVTRVPGLVATMLGAMGQEHQRAAGAWQAEWGTLPELTVLVGSAAAWARDLLEGLVVDPERMAAGRATAAMGERPLPDGAGALVDRALAAHEARPR